MGNVIDYKKVIGKTILISLVSVLLALGVFTTIMFCAFTKTTADYIYNLGFDSWASQLYFKVYEKDGDMLYCYKALSISIRIDNSEKIIKYYDALSKNDGYYQFIEDIENANRELNVGVLEKSRLINEEDYLRDNYISALKKSGKIEDSFQMSLNDFRLQRGGSLSNIGLYSLNVFADGNGLNRFNDTYDGFDDNLVVVMQEYFDNIITVFEDNKDIVNSNIDKACLIALADRIMVVGQDINAVYNFNENNDETIASNIEKMTEVNEVVKGLI